MTTNEMSLSKEQIAVLEAYRNGHNIFITGPAGSGKSFIIHEIVNDAKENGVRIQVCAMTGCAAFLLNCGAKTLHSWAGVGLMTASIHETVEKVKRTQYLRKRWCSTNVLIIDEISMLSAKLFDTLDKIGRSVRGHPDVPFGGMQVILSGDFHQLAPMGEDKYCFESPMWDKNIQTQIELKQIFRQRDARFTKILNQIRKGRISRNSYDVLCSCLNKDKSHLTSGVKPTVLYPRKFQVDRLNNKHMRQLKTPEKTFDHTVISKTISTRSASVLQEIDSMIKHAPFDASLRLKEGAQVMCVANLDVEGGICNGSTGIVTHFDTQSGGFPVVKFHCGITRVIGEHSWTSQNIPTLSIVQIPLVAAWAITIHKAQGATLDLVEIDIGSAIFAYGQTYVALSRVKSLEGLYLRSFCPQRISRSEKVDAFYRTVRTKKTILMIKKEDDDDKDDEKEKDDENKIERKGEKN